MKKVLVADARSGIISKVIESIKMKYYIYVTVETEKQLEFVKKIQRI